MTPRRVEEFIAEHKSEMKIAEKVRERFWKEHSNIVGDFSVNNLKDVCMILLAKELNENNKGMELDALDKSALIELKEDISNRIKKFVAEEPKPKSNTLLDLKEGDKILGIRLYAGPHRLKEAEELNCEVDIIDYCDITGNDIRTSGYEAGTFRLGISYEHGALGITTTLYTEEDSSKHCLLFLSTSNNGYDAFYTLKPESWLEDIKKAYNEKLEIRSKFYKKESRKYDKKFHSFLINEDKINEHIGEL